MGPFSRLYGSAANEHLLERYAEYIQGIYSALIGLATIAVVLVVGWIILRLIFAKSSLRGLYEWLYLAACGGIYLCWIVFFVR